MNVGALALIIVALAGCDSVFVFDNHDDDDDAAATSDANAPDAPDAPGLRCTMDTDCGDAGLHCAVENGACLECFLNAHCTQPGKLKCDLIGHRCVECTDGDDCALGTVCARVGHVCVKSCHDSDDCPLTSEGCDPDKGVCINCRIDADCSEATTGPRCQTSSGRCLECVDDGDCTADHPHCDTFGGHCVECLGNDACPTARPLCDPNTLSCR